MAEPSRNAETGLQGPLGAHGDPSGPGCPCGGKRIPVDPAAAGGGKRIPVDPAAAGSAPQTDPSGPGCRGCHWRGREPIPADPAAAGSAPQTDPLSIRPGLGDIHDRSEGANRSQRTRLPLAGAPTDPADPAAAGSGPQTDPLSILPGLGDIYGRSDPDGAHRSQWTRLPLAGAPTKPILCRSCPDWATSTAEATSMAPGCSRREHIRPVRRLEQRGLSIPTGGWTNATKPGRGPGRGAADQSPSGRCDRI